MTAKQKNKRWPKNQKDKIIAKIKERATCPLAKTALVLIRLSQNRMVPAKYMVDFHISLRDAILFLAKKKSR